MRVARDADAGKGRKNVKKEKKRRNKRKNVKKEKKRRNKRKNEKKEMNKRKNVKKEKKKRNKRKNMKRTNKKKNKKNKSSRSQGRMIEGKCFENAITAMRRWKDQVGNFLKQKTRIGKHSGISENKAGKKAVFGPIAKRLIDVGGGNKSALTCSGSADSDGAKQLANLTMTLEECEKEIHAFCHPENFPNANMTMVEECAKTVEGFENEAKKCFDLSKEATAEDACTCWTSDNMTKYSEDVKSCKISEVGNIAKGLKNCKDAFSKCRKYEDAAISTIQFCSQSADQLKAKAETLSKNKDALTDVKAKIAKATARRRHARAPATDCAGFLKLVVKGTFLFHNYYLIKN